MSAGYAIKMWSGLIFVLVLQSAMGCQANKTSSQSAAPDPQLAALGTIEVTATLLEVPEGAIFERDLYDYATVLKYRVQKIHRGEVKDEIIYVGHYDPWKPRSAAADKRAPNIGGNLRQFQAGQTHHMAMEPSIEDVYMGGIVDKYFTTEPHAIYWAVWTNLEEQ